MGPKPALRKESRRAHTKCQEQGVCDGRIKGGSGSDSGGQDWELFSSARLTDVRGTEYPILY